MPKRILYFDCAYGISGDMTLGALIDTGADFDELNRLLSKLPLRGFQLKKSIVSRCGISAVKIDVIITEEKHHHRSLNDIKNIINDADLPTYVKNNSIKAFEILAVAEAKVHNTSIEKVHFHEVGGIDTIIDIVGSFICLNLLKVDLIYASEITVGSGIVKAHHGELPIPAPATAEILKGVPIKSGDIIGEQTTPTGAAILKTCVKDFIPMPLIKIESIGYGAGSREIPNKPNLLRAIIGLEHSQEKFIENIPLEEETLFKISTEIDDMNTEFYSKIFEDLFKLKCLDAIVIPIIMKKNRPGHSLQVLCSKENLQPISDYILKNTTTFGLKIESIKRLCLKRKFDKVQTKYGIIDVKIGLLEGNNFKIKPEFESCMRLSNETGVPITNIYLAAIAEIERKFSL